MLDDIGQQIEAGFGVVASALRLALALSMAAAEVSVVPMLLSLVGESGWRSVWWFLR